MVIATQTVVLAILQNIHEPEKPHSFNGNVYFLVVFPICIVFEFALLVTAFVLLFSLGAEQDAAYRLYENQTNAPFYSGSNSITGWQRLSPPQMQQQARQYQRYHEQQARLWGYHQRIAGGQDRQVNMMSNVNDTLDYTNHNSSVQRIYEEIADDEYARPRTTEQSDIKMYEKTQGIQTYKGMV